MAENLYMKNGAFERNAKSYIAKLYPEDLEDALNFYNELLANSYSLSRIDKYLATLVSIMRRLERPFKSATKEDVKSFMVKLGKCDYSGWTKRDMKVILRVYMRWLGREDTVDWVVIKQPKIGRLPQEILLEGEIKDLAKAAYTTRDDALVLAIYESGCRIGEFLPLRLRHIQFDRYGAVLFVSGKTGERRVRLVASVLALQRWIEEHPAKNDPNAYLWCKIPTPNNPKWKNKHLSYGFTNRLLRELAKKAGIKKKVTPHSFRHARATFMAKHLKEPEMRVFFGWSKNSDMPGIYVHLSGSDVDSSVLGVYGIKEAEKAHEPVVKVEDCGRCGEKNDPGAMFCRKCGLPLGEAQYSVDKVEEVLIDFLKIIAESFPGVKEKFREVVKEKGAESLFST